MTSNYPPGMTGGSSPAGVMKLVCPSHGVTYGRFLTELGGYFLDATMPRGIDEWETKQSPCPGHCRYLELGEWEPVDAEQCTEIIAQARNPWDDVIEHTVACGAWTEQILARERVMALAQERVKEGDPEYVGIEVEVTEWKCPEGHEFETEIV